MNNLKIYKDLTLDADITEQMWDYFRLMNEELKILCPCIKPIVDRSNFLKMATIVADHPELYKNLHEFFSTIALSDKERYLMIYSTRGKNQFVVQKTYDKIWNLKISDDFFDKINNQLIEYDMFGEFTLVAYNSGFLGANWKKHLLDRLKKEDIDWVKKHYTDEI